MRLTDMTVKALKAPEKGVIYYTDEALAGFGVRVSEGGTKSFVLTHGPRRQRETIGRFGVVSLQDARAEAKRRLAEYTLGRHQSRTVGWNVALEEYLAEVASKRKPRTHADYEYLLTRFFRYGSTKLSDIEPQDLRKSLDKLKNTPAVHQHAFVVLRAFLRWAHRKHYVDVNPMERMQAPHRYVPRERVLTDEELKRIWNAAGDSTFGNIVKLLILTGQRRGEICGLTGEMVGKDAITLPSSLTKNSRQHTIPLGTLARSFVTGPRNREALLFPALGKATLFKGFSPCKRRLDARSGVSGWTLHDLRRTFATGLASIGVSLPVIERLLNHVSGSFSGIVGVYQRYDFLPEMRDAITQWEEHMQELTRG